MYVCVCVCFRVTGGVGFVTRVEAAGGQGGAEITHSSASLGLSTLGGTGTISECVGPAGLQPPKQHLLLAPSLLPEFTPLLRVPAGQGSGSCWLEQGRGEVGGAQAGSLEGEPSHLLTESAH